MEQINRSFHAAGLPQADLQSGHPVFTSRLNKAASDLILTPEVSTTLAEGSEP